MWREPFLHVNIPTMNASIFRYTPSSNLDYLCLGRFQIHWILVIGQNNASVTIGAAPISAWTILWSFHRAGNHQDWRSFQICSVMNPVKDEISMNFMFPLIHTDAFGCTEIMKSVKKIQYRRLQANTLHQCTEMLKWTWPMAKEWIHSILNQAKAQGFPHYC